MGQLGSVFKPASYSQIKLVHYSIKCGLQFQVTDARHDRKDEPMKFMPDEMDGMHDEQHNRQPQRDAVTKKMTATMLFFIFLHAFWLLSQIKFSRPPKECMHNRTPHFKLKNNDEIQYFHCISVHHEHHKKALLIGISYKENKENGSLDGSHTGILELRMMLIGESRLSIRILGQADLCCIFSRVVWVYQPKNCGYA